MPEEIKNYCPFGCARETLDENGYCCHLVGFTSDSTHLEPLVVNKRGLLVVDGKKTSRQPVLKSDKLINPQFPQRMDDGTINLAWKWVSSRVYRQVLEGKNATGIVDVTDGHVRPIQSGEPHQGGAMESRSIARDVEAVAPHFVVPAPRM